VMEQVMRKAIQSVRKGDCLFQFSGPLWDEKKEVFIIIFRVDLFRKRRIPRSPFENIEQLIDLLIKKFEFKLGFSFDRVIQIRGEEYE
jgi:hypothetical protein